MDNVIRFDKLPIGQLFKFDPRGYTICEKSRAGFARYWNQPNKNEFFVLDDELVIKQKENSHSLTKS